MAPSSEPEEDRESFISALLRQDALGAVIRAQIYLEHELIKYVQPRLKVPDALTSQDLSYNRLVRLALALGLRPELGPALKAFAEIRNAFAHRLDSTLTDTRVARFTGSFSEAMRRDAETRIAHIHFPGDVGKTIDNLSTYGRFAMYAISLWVDLTNETEAKQE